MSLQSWQETLISAQIDGTAVTGTAAATLLPAAAKVTLPPGFFSIGKVVRVTALGRISNIVTTPGTLTIDIRTTPGPIIVFNGGATSLNVVAKTNVSWKFEALLTCRAIGASTTANLMGEGVLTSESVVGAAAGTALQALLPATAPAVGTGFDSTVSMVVDMFATFSLTGNSIQVHQYILEALN